MSNTLSVQLLIKSNSVLLIIALVSVSIIAQLAPEEYHETPSDIFYQIDKEKQPRSPAYRVSSGNFNCIQVNVDDNGNNILGDAANEPSIAVDPTNLDRIAIGWRQFDTIANNFRQGGFAFSVNGGINWTSSDVIDPGVFRSDPVLEYDSEGKFYYNSLTYAEEFFCDVYRAPSDNIWDAGVFAWGGDKQWMAIDRTGGPGHGNIYAYWSLHASGCDGNFTRSTDGGDSYESCTTIPSTARWGTLTVGPGGELYVIGVAQFAKSSNAQYGNEDIHWELTSSLGLGGSFAFNDNSPNPGGLLGQQWVAVDHSGGPNHGNIYILGSVRSENDTLDVHFISSSDGGQTWTSPIVINDDGTPTNWQWFGTMSVAPNGRIDVVWLDTRDHPGTFLSSLYYSFSIDGGDSWSVNQRLSDEFDPHVGWPNQNKMGDYFDMISDNEGAHLAWAATFNGEQNVYYSFIVPEFLNVADIENTGKSLSQNYPNPSFGQTTIPWALDNPGYIEIKIYDINGILVQSLINKYMPTGKYNTLWKYSDTKASSSGGLFYYTLYIDGHSKSSRKMVVF